MEPNEDLRQSKEADRHFERDMHPASRPYPWSRSQVNVAVSGALLIVFILGLAVYGIWDSLNTALAVILAIMGLTGYLVWEAGRREALSAALREAEQRYRSLFQANPHPMWIYDTETLIFFAVNDAAANLYGYSRAEFFDMTIRDIRPPEEIERIEELVATLSPKLHQSGIWRHRKKDGTVFDADIVSHGFHFGDRPARLVQAQDVSARLRAERQLRASEERYRHLFEGNPIAIWVMDEESLRLVAVNQAAVDKYGYTRNEFLELTVDDMQVAEDRGRVIQQIRSRDAGAIAHYLRRHVTKDGRIINAEVTAQPFMFHGRPARMILIHDVTERRRAEIEHAHLAAIVENTDDAIVSRQVDGTLLTWNRGAEKIFGYSAAEMVGRSISVLAPPEFREDSRRNSEALLSGKVVPTFESVRIAKDGRRVDVQISVAAIRDAGGSLTAVAAIFRDITERKRVEAALRASEERFRTIFEQAGVGMALRGIDPRYSRWERVNQKLCDILGYTRDELLQLSSVDLTPPEDRETAIGYNERLMRGEIAGYTREKRYVRKNGEIIWASISLSVLRGPDGAPAHIISVIHDITGRKEIEERFRATFEQAAVGIMHTSLDRRILMVNQKFCSMIGYSSDELLNMYVPKIHHPDDTDKDRHLEKKLLDGEIDTYSFEKRYIRKDGSLLWCNRTVSLMRDDRGNPKYFIRVIEDVSARMKIEQTLRESEERLRTITDNVPALIGYVDLEERYQFVNRTYEEWFGLAHDFCLGRRLREILREADYIALRPYIETAYAGTPVTFDRAHEKDGRKRSAIMSYVPDFDAMDRVRGFYFLGYDVTERKLAEESLARERTLLRTVIDNLPDRVYVKDSARRYLLVNRTDLGFRDLATDETVLGKTAQDVMPPGYADAFDAEDRAVLETGKPLTNREIVIKTEAGDKAWVVTNKIPLRDAEGNIFGLVGIHRDITQIRQSAEAIVKLNAELENRVKERTAQLEAANKELESFAYSVSHDLRAPLRSIDGFSLVLLDDYRDTLEPTALDYLRRVRAASQRMAALIDDLLSLSRITRSEMLRQPTDLSALAEDIISGLRKEQPRRQVDFKAEKGIRVSADPGLMRVAMDNLLGNAWKFTDRQTRAMISVGVTSRNGQPVYFIRDNGAGFDMRYADKLFGAFQRLHREADFPGTGVGLATVQRIIQRHGGTIWAEAEPGKGAAFFFTLGA